MSGWVVERTDLHPGTHYMADARRPGDHWWTTDPNQAKRFPTCAAAEAACYGGHLNGPLRVAEHCWVNMPPRPVEPPRAAQDGMPDLAHLSMSLSYVPTDARVPETMRQMARELTARAAQDGQVVRNAYTLDRVARLEAENARLREALGAEDAYRAASRLWMLATPAEMDSRFDTVQSAISRRSAARAALSATPAQAAPAGGGGWLPIATAPRSKRVLICYPSGVIDIAKQWNTPDGWKWITDDRESVDTGCDAPTHWQLLPTPPATERADG